MGTQSVRAARNYVERGRVGDLQTSRPDCTKSEGSLRFALFIQRKWRDHHRAPAAHSTITSGIRAIITMRVILLLLMLSLVVGLHLVVEDLRHNAQEFLCVCLIIVPVVVSLLLCNHPCGISSLTHSAAAATIAFAAFAAAFVVIEGMHKGH